MSMGDEAQHPAKEAWRPTRKQIIAAVIAVVALVFILQNTRSAHFNFPWFEFEAPVWIWMLVIFVGGVATGLLIASRRAGRNAAGA